MVFLTEQALPIDEQLSLDAFYQLDKQTRSKTIANVLDGLIATDPTMKLDSRIHQHWEDEVGYSFPSGHTIFAATLVLTASYYLLCAGLPMFAILLLGWGLLMGLSPDVARYALAARCALFYPVSGSDQLGQCTIG